jgi:hypothetical protein
MSEFSPIYYDHYTTILATRTFQNFILKVTEEIRSLRVETPKVATDWEQRAVLIPQYILFGSCEKMASKTRTHLIGELKNPGKICIIWIDTIPNDTAMKLYDDCVSTHRINVHGLIQRDTIEHGTCTHKNRFKSFVADMLRGNKGIDEACYTARSRVIKETLHIADTDVELIKKLHRAEVDGIVAALKNFRHLPEGVIRQAVEEFFVHDIIEE